MAGYYLCSDILLNRNYYRVEGGDLGNETFRDQNSYNTGDEIVLEAGKYAYTLSGEYYFTALTYTSLMVTFTTPNANSNFNNLKCEFIVSSNLLLNDVLYSVSSSNQNFNRYSYGSVSDSYIISSVGTISKDLLVDGSIYSINMDSLDLQPNTTYYLMMYLSNISSFGSHSPSYDNTLSLNSVNISVGNEASTVRIDSNGTGFSEYSCYIDNGSAFKLYAPYIDNGTSWEQL